jgi:hypothetical protein
MASVPQPPAAPRDAQPSHDTEAPAPAPLAAGEPELATLPTPNPSVINPPDAHVPVEIDEVLHPFSALLYRHLTHLQYDSAFETDSAVGSDGEASSTSSLTSSILNYKYENGRTYHAFRDGEYIMPNDDKEQVTNAAIPIKHNESLIM